MRLADGREPAIRGPRLGNGEVSRPRSHAKLGPRNIVFEQKTKPKKMRTSPNIIITGTPGVGKTTHCEQLASSTGLTHLNVNKVVKERDCEDGFDDELNSVIVDEDKVRTGGLS